MVEQRVPAGVGSWGIAVSVNKEVRREWVMGHRRCGRSEERLEVVLYCSTTEETRELILEKQRGKGLPTEIVIFR